MWLGITDIKNELKSNLTLYFKDKGFQFKTGFNGGNIGFKEKDTDFFYIFFGIFSTGKILLNPLCGYLDKVERILFNIRLPNKSVQYYYEKPYNILAHISIIENNNFRVRLESDTLYSREEVSSFCDRIIEYMDTRGVSFIERNNSLEKIYAQIIHNWKDNNLDPISEHSDNYFKALIILKLMNDPNIEDYKMQFKDRILEYKNPEAWLKSYQNLCDLLDSPSFEKEHLL